MGKRAENSETTALVLFGRVSDRLVPYVPAVLRMGCRSKSYFGMGMAAPVLSCLRDGAEEFRNEQFLADVCHE